VLSLERLIGGRIEDELRPFLLMLLLALAAQYAFLAYFPIWAVTRLGVSSSLVGIGLSAGGVLAALAGPLGGRVSDRVGRPRVVAAGLLATTLAPLALVGPTPAPAIGLAAFGLFAVGTAVRWTAQQALVADLVVSGGRERVFGILRIAYQVGAVAGPILGSALVLVDFRLVFAAAAALSLGALALIPRLPAGRSSETAERSTTAWSVLRTPAVVVALVASLLAWCVYQAFELLLPISLVRSHGYSPAAWGLLFVINPALIAVLQVRVTGWTTSVPRELKLGVGSLLMGTSFLLVVAGASPLLLVVTIAGFTVGEMLYGPSNQALMTDLAPEDQRGLAMGALSSTSSLSVVLTPGIGLGLSSAYGDSAMWMVIAAVAATVAALYVGPLWLRRAANR
jgi:MFS family permease